MGMTAILVNRPKLFNINFFLSMNGSGGIFVKNCPVLAEEMSYDYANLCDIGTKVRDHPLRSAQVS